MKKVTALIIMFLILLTACGGNNPIENVETTAGKSDETSSTVSEVSTEPVDKPIFTDNDYGGRKFTILYPEWGYYTTYTFAEEADGDVMNDALFERFLRINEELDIKIEWYEGGYIDHILAELRKTVLGGMDKYDLLLTHCVQDIVTNISDNLILNWNRIPNINMDKSYWNQSLRKNFETSGMLGYAVNDFILPDVNAIFFNKTLSAKLNIENIYNFVYDNNWTWDKLSELALLGTLDLNGDGVFDENDQYGFVGELSWQFGSVPSSGNEFIVQIDSDGIPQITIKTEKYIRLVEKVWKLLHEDNKSFTWAYRREYYEGAMAKPPVNFADGSSLFYLSPLYHITGTLRSMEQEYSVLPFPKFDEKQENYLSLNWSGYMAVPFTASDPGLVGKVSELLGYYGQKIVFPAYYEVLLQQKISRDPDTIKMFDIIFEGAVYDFGVALGLYQITHNLLTGKGDNFSSYIDSNMKSWQKTLDNYIKACADYINIHGK